MSVAAIVAAAGVGERLRSRLAKPFHVIGGVPLVVHTLKQLSVHPLIDGLIVVFSANNIERLEQLIDEHKIKKIKKIVEGGATRAQSVRNGLKHTDGYDFILVHDGARPFTEHRIIDAAIKKAKTMGAVVVGLPVSSTIKRVDAGKNEVDATLRREQLWQIQTPQVFRSDIIKKAYEQTMDEQAPDDAFLVEQMGGRVGLVEGSPFNIKITTPEDFVLAEAINVFLQNKGKRK